MPVVASKYLLLLGACTLCACGFRLAGSDPLPAVMARPYLSLKDPYTDFSREFEHQLKSSGATPQLARATATAAVEVTKDLVEQRTLAVSAKNIPTEYELTYTVTDGFNPTTVIRTVNVVDTTAPLLTLLGANHLPPVQGVAPWAPVLEQVTIDFLDRYVAGRTTTDQAIIDAGHKSGVATLESAG